MWQLVNFLLEGFVFLLIGQQLPVVVRGLDTCGTATIASAAAITVGVVLALRPVWLLLTQHVPRWLHSRLGDEDGGDGANGGVGQGGRDCEPADREVSLSGTEVTALSWAGTRGVITLAAAFAIPATTRAGHAFPARDLLLFLAYLVVLVTLLGQGLTFGPLLRRLGLRPNLVDQARLRNQARTAAVEAALGRLDQMAEEEQLPDSLVSDLRGNLTARLNRYRSRLAYLEDNPAAPRAAGYEAAIRALHAVIDARHEELLRWRDAGRLPDASLRVLQRELDYEERTLPVPPA